MCLYNRFTKSKVNFIVGMAAYFIMFMMCQALFIVSIVRIMHEVVK